MADQDFKINIRTVADTTGFKQTSAEADALLRKAEAANARAKAQMAEAEARWARSPLNPKNAATQPTPPTPPTEGGLSGVGSAAAVGLIVSLLTGAIGKVKQFIDEQNALEAAMIKAREAMRLEALEVVKIKELDLSEELIKQASSVDELVGNFGRLTQQIAQLKAQQDALDPLTQSKDWKNLRTEINAYQSQLKSVQSQLEQKGVTDFTPKIPGPKAGKGESQALVDEIERNRKAAEEQLKEDVWEIDPETGAYRRTGQKRFPLFQAPPQPPQQSAQPDWTTGVGKIGVNWKDLFKQAFDESMAKYWGP